MRRGALTLALLLHASPISAQPPAEVADPASAEAHALFDRGRELAEARRFSEAVHSFTRSLELVDRPSTVFNLALCHYALERYVEAVAALERFERDADPSEEAASLVDARRMLTHARGAIARIAIEVEPADAEVTIDGERVEGAGIRSIEVNPGPHVVRVTGPHHEPVLLELDAERGASLRRAVVLTSTRQPARLEIELVDRPRATITIDGRVAGTGSAALDLDAGRHAIRVVDADAPPLERAVELAWSERVRVVIAAGAPATSVFEEPAFWGVLGGTLGAIAAGVLIGVLVAEWRPTPDGGSTGEVLSLAALPGLSLP